MTKTERSLLSLILVPVIITNLVTLLRLTLELLGFSYSSPKDFAWWMGIFIFIPLCGLYFAYQLRESANPYKRLALTLLVYGLSVRVVVAFVYWLSGTMNWKTHYSIYGPPGQNWGFIKGALLPQMLLWPLFTLIGGLIFGLPVLLYLRAGKTAKAAA
jgi:hypothetical protein